MTATAIRRTPLWVGLFGFVAALAAIVGRETWMSDVAFVFFGRPDFWIELRRPVVVRGIFGISRTTRWLGMGAGDAPALRRRLDAAELA